jgi:penicillin-insensitive murein DD-endopeptidase
MFLCSGLWACWSAPSSLDPHLSGSLGLPHNGSLQGAAALPKKGPGFRRLRRNGANYGNRRLIDAIAGAAAHVAQERPGVRLVIGDVSARRGGKIPRHRSHRTGRDIDLLFYTLSPSGYPVENDRFVHFGPDSVGRYYRKKKRYLRFDVERNWLLVKHLLENDKAQVQWIFVARWLEALMLEFARARGESDSLVWHAGRVLHQPGDSFPHDDHFHLRIACTESERARGCTGGGYHWPWFPPRLAPFNPSDRQLLATLFDDA